MNKKVDISSGEEVAKKDQKETRLTCGIIMPIATMSSEYTADHWSDVRHILHNAIEKAGFTPRIVSDSEESTIKSELIQLSLRKTRFRGFFF